MKKTGRFLVPLLAGLLPPPAAGGRRGGGLGAPVAEVVVKGLLAASWPAPLIAVDEGEQFYLTLTNVGMLIRPDLFDPHTVHFHGFPNASAVFAVLTGSPPQAGYRYAYNDGDGSTRYDVEAALQLGGFDPEFHDASWNVQPLPFAMMRDTYPMINGRGYPDTVNTGAMHQPLDPDTGEDLHRPAVSSQAERSRITAAAGQRILLRLSNLNITVSHTLISPSIPMEVVGIDARELRTADGSAAPHYKANSVTPCARRGAT